MCALRGLLAPAQLLVQSFLKDVLARGPKTIQTQNMFQKTNASLHDFLRQACLDSAS